MNRNLLLCAALACAATLSAQTSLADVNKDNYTNYPDGNFVYQFNNEVNPKGAKLAGTVWNNIFPTPKQVTLAKGFTTLPKQVKLERKTTVDVYAAQDYLESKLLNSNIATVSEAKFVISLDVNRDAAPSNEGYTLTVGKEGIEIVGCSPDGVMNGVKTLVAAIEIGGMKLPNVAISDYPDFGYRGLMLDISRNYTSFDDIKRTIDLMAAYKLNVFHFHFADDEAWCLEIPGLPELTEVGAVRENTYDEKNAGNMALIYGGYDLRKHLKRNDQFITRSQFIELLKYAQKQGVRVIPEVDAPGHSRAAIVSMMARSKKYIDTDHNEALRYKMWDEGDTSKFCSAQGYGDNVLNIALPGTYRFMEKVFDEILDMYREAGVKLEVFHFGGDEVAHGALEGSPEARKFMEQNGMKTMHELSEFFVDRMSAYIAMHGVKAGAWQEAALKHSDDFNRRVAPRFGLVNAWSTNGSSDYVPYTLANAGYPVVMSNVRNFYLDMVYTPHQDEQGLRWGGWCNEFTAWSALPYNTYRSAREGERGEAVDLATITNGKPTLKKRECLIGVQAQIWAETIRNYSMVQRYTFPKVLGMVERGWNASPAWGEGATNEALYKAEMAKYNLRIGTRELPRLARHSVDFHVNQPGIIVENGKLKANTCYPGMTVRYTLDGSDPGENSPVWKAPVSIGNAKLIKARAYYLGHESVATYLFVK